MSDLLFSLILEIVFIVFCAITILIILRTYLEIKESIYLGLIVFFVVMLFNSIFRIANLFFIDLDLVFGARLSLSNIIALLIFNIQLRFFFYLKKLKKLYWLPLVISFYVGFGLYLNESLVFFISYAVVIGFVIPVILLREGRKTRNGLAFGLGLFFLLYGLSKLLQFPFLPEIIRIIGIIISTLAVLEFFDKHLFQDKDEKEKIQNAWISKLTVKK
ncbi:MAG: hypothetical protein ACTSO6_03605 [Promethearchaeota archaeon]